LRASSPIARSRTSDEARQKAQAVAAKLRERAAARKAAQ
jgi:hypothetical protein